MFQSPRCGRCRARPVTNELLRYLLTSFKALGVGDAAHGVPRHGAVQPALLWVSKPSVWAMPRGADESWRSTTTVGVSKPSVWAMPRAAAIGRFIRTLLQAFQSPRCGRCRARRWPAWTSNCPTGRFKALGVGDAARGVRAPGRLAYCVSVSKPSVWAMPRAACGTLAQPESW